MGAKVPGVTPPRGIPYVGQEAMSLWEAGLTEPQNAGLIVHNQCEMVGGHGGHAFHCAANAPKGTEMSQRGTVKRREVGMGRGRGEDRGRRGERGELRVYHGVERDIVSPVDLDGQYHVVGCVIGGGKGAAAGSTQGDNWWRVQRREGTADLDGPSIWLVGEAFVKAEEEVAAGPGG